jgi:DNA-binding transcriptional regulator YiaG
MSTRGALQDRLPEALALKRVRRLVKADRLRDLREDAGLTQAAVARHLGVSPSNVSRWESGESRPAFRRLVRKYGRPDGTIDARPRDDA